MKSNTGSERLDYVDVFKALLITLVVLGHSMQSSVADFEGNLGVKAIYSFHMAAFFFVSGFVAFALLAVWAPHGVGVSRLN